MPVDAEISKAWIEAAADLDLLATAPFNLTSRDGTECWFEAHIANFGGPKGTVVGNLGNDLRDIRAEHGYYASNLSPSYRTYQRQLFIDSLNDWSWYGEKRKEPRWYTGKPWS